jgi:hypothetical protein
MARRSGAPAMLEAFGRMLEAISFSSSHCVLIRMKKDDAKATRPEGGA